MVRQNVVIFFALFVVLGLGLWGQYELAPGRLRNEFPGVLYEKYLLGRHMGGGMDNPTPESYMKFLTASWAKTAFYEMRLQGDNSLLAIAVVDIMENALSAVYTFFDPAYAHKSLGRFAVLLQIEEARKQGLSSLYLGYWIEDCKKMNYKDEYQPLEYYRNSDWRRDPEGL